MCLNIMIKTMASLECAVTHFCIIFLQCTKKSLHKCGIGSKFPHCVFQIKTKCVNQIFIQNCIDEGIVKERGIVQMRNRYCLLWCLIFRNVQQHKLEMLKIFFISEYFWRGLQESFKRFELF